MKKISLIIFLMATLLTSSLLAYSTIDNEPANSSCPGISIAELEDISIYKIISADMSMGANSDSDRLFFTPAVKGTLKITINSDQPINLRVGTTCKHQEYYYMLDQTSYEKSVEVPANAPIHIMPYNWSSGDGYDYTLDIEFTPESEEETPDTNNTTTSTLDNEPDNSSCPGISIPELENISIHKIISADMSMGANYDSDRLFFTPAVKGTLKVTINSDQPINLRVGTTCKHQEYYYMLDQTSYEKSVEVPANAPIHIMPYNWSSGDGYDYTLDIEFTPESEEETPDTNNTTQDDNTDYGINNLQGNGEDGTITHTTQTNQLIGTTKGNFSVNQGAANYTLDITVPPGRAGMQPKISLDYNSNAGDGYLGRGWGIGGLSVISRCPSTKAVDGEIRGIKLDEDDKYCLNGQRLIKLPDTPTQGDAEYKTEIDNYSKVVSYSPTDYGPRYWRVWTKSGLIYEYGNSDGSRIKTKMIRDVDQDESVVSWAVNKIKDRTQDGNDIDFTYYSDTLGGKIYR